MSNIQLLNIPSAGAFHKHTCRNIVVANIAMMLQGYHLIYQCNVAMPLSIRIPYDICNSKEKINEIHIFRTQVSDSKVNHCFQSIYLIHNHHGDGDDQAMT